MFQGLGSCLRPNKETKERDQAKHKLVAVDAVLVRFKTPSHYAYSDGISSNDKLSLLEGFAILKTLGKRLNWFANDFKLRHFPRNHAIYQAGEHATCVCFTVSGQICLLSAGVTDSAPNIET